MDVPSWMLEASQFSSSICSIFMAPGRRGNSCREQQTAADFDVLVLDNAEDLVQDEADGQTPARLNGRPWYIKRAGRKYAIWWDDGNANWKLGLLINAGKNLHFAYSTCGTELLPERLPEAPSQVISTPSAPGVIRETPAPVRTSAPAPTADLSSPSVTAPMPPTGTRHSPVHTRMPSRLKEALLFLSAIYLRSEHKESLSLEKSNLGTL